MNINALNLGLRQNEKLLWQSSDRDYGKLESLTKKSIIIMITIVVCFVLLITLLVKDIIISAITAIVSILPLIILCINLSIEIKEARKSIYILTDQRAIVYNEGPHSKEYSEMYSAREIVDGDKINSIYFGTGLNLTDESLIKSLSEHEPKPGRAFLENNFIFYALDNCTEALNILKQYIKIDSLLDYSHVQE